MERPDDCGMLVERDCGVKRCHPPRSELCGTLLLPGRGMLFLIAPGFSAPWEPLKEAFGPPRTFVPLVRFAPLEGLDPKGLHPGLAAVPRGLSAPWFTRTPVFGRAMLLFAPPKEERFPIFELELPGRGTLLLPANPRFVVP